MDKKVRIQVQLEAETLDFIRAKTRLVGGSISGYIRGVLMAHVDSLVTIGDIVDIEKESEVAVSLDNVTFGDKLNKG